MMGFWTFPIGREPLNWKLDNLSSPLENITQIIRAPHNFFLPVSEKKASGESTEYSTKKLQIFFQSI